MQTEVRHLSETISTSADAEALFASGKNGGPLWIWADRQTGGVGRRGRVWQHDLGNFAGTLLWPIVADDLRTPALFSFAAGLATRSALIAAGAEPQNLALKWPNDVLFHGEKISGILTQLLGPNAAGERSVAIGIGVNLVSAPDITPLKATSLALQSGMAPPPPAEFIPLLDQAFREEWDQFQTHGFGAIRCRWLAHAAGIGDKITARLVDKEITGTFVGLDENGALQLQTAHGAQTLTAADIFLGTVPK